MRVQLSMTFFLSAHHWVTMNKMRGHQHTHVWELTLRIGSEAFRGSDLEVGFAEVESMVREYLSHFEGKALNEFKPFDTINPSTENLGVFFARGLITRLSAKKFVLEELAIKESPTKGFVITDLYDEAVSGWDNRFSGEPVGVEHEPGVFPHGGPENSGSIFTEAELSAREIAAASSEVINEETPDPGGGNDAPFQVTSKWHLPVSLLIIFLLNFGLYSSVLFSSSPFPWGSDTWGHLFKAEFLIQSIQSGHLIPRYLPDWYNGIDPFRYYAPLSYYALAAIGYITGDTFRALGVFVFLSGFIGGSFWMLFRRRFGLSGALSLAVLWSLSPDNIRVAFSEGNLPRVMAVTFLPLLIYLVTELLKSRQSTKLKVLVLILTVNAIVLSHAMVGALFLTGMGLYSLLVLFFGGTDFKRLLRILLLLAASLMTTGWWLFPSLIGGITSINQEAMSESATYVSPLVSLNPLARLHNPEALYFGLGYLVLCVLACYRWRERDAFQKAGLVLGLVILVITTPFAKPFYEKLPLHNLLWPDRFVPVGVAAILLGSARSIKFAPLVLTRKYFKLGLCLLIAAFILGDSLISLKLVRTRVFPSEIDGILREASSSRGYKVAVLDSSKLGSIPTYLAGKHGMNQIFGWAWQGAYTGENTMLINSAQEKGWYDFVFDRLREMGATHLVVKDDVIKKPKAFRAKANQYGYILKASRDGMSLYSWQSGPYMVSADYKIMGIGKFTPNIATVFPEIKLGAYNELDKYSLAELRRYKTLFLSGFSWQSKKAAEDLVLAYVRQGGQVVIDLSGTPADILSNRSSFLGVVGEPVVMDDPPLISIGSNVRRLSPLPQENLPWKTFVLEGVDKVSSLVDYYDRRHPIEGYKVYKNQPIYFVGLNLPYYAYLTRDPVVLKMMGDLLQTKAGQTIERHTIPLDKLEFNGDDGIINFNIPPEYAGTDLIIPVAYLDSMQVSVTGPKNCTVKRTHNLITVNGEGGAYQMHIRNNWPASTKTGVWISAVGIILGFMLLGIRPLTHKFKWSVGAAMLMAGLLLAAPHPAMAAQDIRMDGQFDDWNGQAYVDDPQGDVQDVSDRTSIAGDARRLYWGSNAGEDEPNLYFSLVRYEPMDDSHKMTGRIMFDINNNGDYTDPDDRIGFFRYNPDSGKVAVKIYRVDGQNDRPVWHDIGNWGATKNGPDGGNQFEFYFPFSSLGIIQNQPIRFYCTTSFVANDNPKQDDDWVRDQDFNDFDLFRHDFDVMPDPEQGDILYSPVPAMGYPLLIVFGAIALTGGVVLIKRGKLA